MSEDLNKSGSVHGDDGAKSASDSETEDKKKNDLRVRVTVKLRKGTCSMIQ